jgi:hypothetical protein
MDYFLKIRSIDDGLAMQGLAFAAATQHGSAVLAGTAGVESPQSRQRATLVYESIDNPASRDHNGR